MVSKPGGLELEPRPRIFSLCIIPAYKSAYSGAHITQIIGPSERSGRALTGTQ
jgi:hypothetical protein